MLPRICLLLAALFGASGVGLGAYHAHGLEKRLDRLDIEAAAKTKRLDNCATAVKYQLYHAVAFLGLASVATLRPGRAAAVTALLWTAGTCGFSGGLYWFVFTGSVGHWAIVPSGGVLLIVGWLTLAGAAWGLTNVSTATDFAKNRV
mgnify:CR=1 FL=1